MKTATGIPTGAFICDRCGGATKHAERHEVRIPRPSNPSDWTVTMWTCPACAKNVGAKSVAEWKRWIASDDAREKGALTLS